MCKYLLFVFLSVGLCLSVMARALGNEEKVVAITIDDLPFVNEYRYPVEALKRWNDSLVSTLQGFGVSAVGFVNEEKLLDRGEFNQGRLSILGHWIEAGMELGNHTYSHGSLNALSVEKFKADVLRGERSVRPMVEKRGRVLRYFRHPYLHVGLDLETRNSVEGFLVDNGYVVAPVTVNNSDWIYNLAYEKVRKQTDINAIGDVVSAYLDHIDASFGYAEQLTLDIFGNPIPHVLVLHANTINGDHLEKVLLRIQRRGYRFASLEEVLSHRAYGTPDHYAGSGSDSWLHHWALTAGLRPHKEPQPPGFIRKLAGPDGKIRY